MLNLALVFEHKINKKHIQNHNHKSKFQNNNKTYCIIIYLYIK